MTNRTRVLILGAGGRDFHVFNTCFRADSHAEVVAFTATQIPNIEHRTYPAILAGPLYPHGIQIRPEDHLEAMVRVHAVERVVFAYSDVTLAYVDAMRKRVEALGATFETMRIGLTHPRLVK